MRIPILLITILLFLQSCINLKAVNDYSTRSAAGIRKFEEVGYTFRQHCTDRCAFEAASQYSIKRETECNCDLYKTADSVTQLLYNAIRGYFDGLAGLSDNKLTSYSFDALQKSLSTGSFGGIQISDAEVKAYSKLSTVLLRATTDLYRKHKLKIYIEQANEPLQILLSKFSFILGQDLTGELDFKKERLYNYYKELGLTGTLSDYEKQKAANEYYQQLSDASRVKKQIETFSKGLISIAAGHQQLYERRNKLSTKALKGTIQQYASDVQDIIAAFNKLKK